MWELAKDTYSRLMRIGFVEDKGNDNAMLLHKQINGKCIECVIDAPFLRRNKFNKNELIPACSISFESHSNGTMIDTEFIPIIATKLIFDYLDKKGIK